MLKADIISKLEEIGYPDPQELWSNTFRGMPRNDRAEMLQVYINQSKQVTNTQESTPMSNDTNNANAVTVSLEIIKSENDYPMFIIMTPSNAKGIEIPVGERFGSMSESAINAYTDYFHFDRNGHMEPGLHLNVPVDALADIPYSENLGYVSKGYEGSLLIPAPRYGDWGIVTVSNGKFKTTKVAYNNRGKMDKTTNKHNFVDMLLKGYTLKVHLFKVHRNWINAVLDTLENPNKDEAYALYQQKKHEAGIRAKANQAGKKVVQAARKLDEGTTVEGTPSEQLIYQATTIKVEINGQKEEKAIDSLQVGMYSVVNSRGRTQTAVNVTGSNMNRQTLIGYALRGWTLVRNS